MLDEPRTDGFEHISEPIKRIIERIPRPDVPKNIPSSHYQLGKPSDQHVYTDEQGKPLVVVYRYDNRDNSDKSPKKEFRPYTIALRKWRAPDVRPLYRLDALAKFKGPVVLVEGEKCADALNDIGILATSAFGGCNGVGKTDFNPLRGRDVIIWPDNDEPGLKYAEASLYSLAKVGADSISIVPLAKGNANPTQTEIALAKGNDVADAIADGWDELSLRVLLAKAIPFKEKLSGDHSLNDDALKLTAPTPVSLNEQPFKETEPLNESPLT